MMTKKRGYIVLLVCGLVGVRFIAPMLFNDPFIDFFHHADYSLKELPTIQFGFFVFSLGSRFAINMLLTLGLVQVLFGKKELTQLTMYIHLLVFILLTPVFLWLIYHASTEQYRYLFYIRRILIHPVLTLILIPALLFQERSAKKE